MLLLTCILFITVPLSIYISWNLHGNKQVSLTAKERAYLQSISPIKIAVDPDWEPFEKVDENGRYIGIAADYVNIIEKRLHVPFEVVPTKDWGQSLEYSKAGKVMILPFLNKTKEREEWLIFTEPLIVDDNCIIGRYNTPYVDDLARVKNKTIALPEGTSVEERIRKDYSNLKIIVTETEIQAFEMVANGEADYTIRSMLIVAYNIRKQGWFDLKVVGEIPNYTNHLAMGVLKEEVMLKNILNKAILSITEQERVKILNKHVPLRVETATNSKMILQSLVITSIVATIFLLYSMYQLLRTKKLQKHNEKIQAITERYEALSELAGTYFWQVNQQGYYTYVSPEVKRVLGYEVQELLGMSYKELHTDETSFANTICLGTIIQDQEVQKIKKDGQRVWMKIDAMPVKDENGQVIGYRGSSTNIEIRKQLQLELIRTKDEIELAFYQSQIAPHFLYNALSAIAMYCMTEPKKASNLILDLSFFLRKTFDFKKTQYAVTLEQELELITAYVNIEKVRFGNRLHIEYELDDVSRQLLLPPLILQPLVENAINHGIMKRLEGGSITIRAIHCGATVRFEVCDDGVGISPECIQYIQSIQWNDELLEIPIFEKHGVALKNIQTRLAKLYNSKLMITINESGGTTVSFEIPANVKGAIT